VTLAAANLGLTTLPAAPFLAESDGADIWVSVNTGRVSRVRASDGRLLETWTGALSPNAVLSAMGKIFVTGQTLPGRLHQIEPSQPAGVVTTVASNLGDAPDGIAYDGLRIWTADEAGSVSI
jgi:hypothetical protein